jgi:hypothetical protein
VAAIGGNPHLPEDASVDMRLVSNSTLLLLRVGGHFEYFCAMWQQLEFIVVKLPGTLVSSIVRRDIPWSPMIDKSGVHM